MVDIHRAQVIHVEHLRVDKSSNHSSGSNYGSKRGIQSSSSASVPLPTRSTRDLSINNTSAHRQRNQAGIHEKKYDTVQVTAVTEKDFANQSYQERLSHYASSMGNDKNSDAPRDPDSDELVQLLAMQVYHLPGNNWCQDWWQFMANNHPVFGICCHYKLHPIGYKTRIVALIGTVLFGLAMTNAFYLFYLWNPEFDRIVAEFVTANGDTIVLTTGMLLLWTLGGGIHCALNLFMWHLAACACCRSGGCCESCACCPSLGKKMLLMFVLGILALCIMIILLRVAINGQQDSLIETEGVTVSESDKGIDIQIDDQLDLEVQSASEFSFVAGYLVEMVLSFFIYYPIGGTILFSGILACGFKIPVLGGRPYEVYSEEKRKAKQNGGSGVMRSSTNDDVEQPRSNRNSVKASLT